MDAALRIALEKFRDGRIRTRWLHQLDLAVRKLDVGQPHALLFVHHPLADRKPEPVGKRPRRGLDVRHHDRHMTETGDHRRPRPRFPGATAQ
jgi:hypothetical protein